MRDGDGDESGVGLTGGLVSLEADPDAAVGDFGHGADEADDAAAGLADAAALADLDAAVAYDTPHGLGLALKPLLLVLAVRVEAAQLLAFLPGQHRVGALLVELRGHLPLLDLGGVGEVEAGRGWARVYHLLILFILYLNLNLNLDLILILIFLAGAGGKEGTSGNNSAMVTREEQG